MYLVKLVASLLSLYLSLSFAEAMRKREPLRSQALKVLVVGGIVAWLVLEHRGGINP